MRVLLALGVAKEDLAALAEDPPGHNFMVIGKPTSWSVPQVKLAYGLTEGEVKAFNSWITNVGKQAGIGRVASVSFKRASGAARAGNSIG